MTETTGPAAGAEPQTVQPSRRRSARAPDQRPVSDALLKRITRYSGTLSTEAVRSLEEDLPFFAGLSADPKKRDHFNVGAGRRVCPGNNVAERSGAVVVMRD